MMKPATILILVMIWAGACNTADKKTPDVSGVKVALQTLRFEQDLFSLDTLNMTSSMQALQQKYGGFLSDFMVNILGVPLEDPQAALILRKFISDFKPVKAATDAQFRDFTPWSREVEQMLKYVKHHFPQYPLPGKLITFVGPMDAFYESSLGWSGDIITTSGLGVGLQMHLGGTSPFYAQDQGRGYPEYIARRFEPAYIPVNCARNIIDDMFPGNGRGSAALVDQMVDKGKRLYLLDLLLPFTADTLKIGYSKLQLEGCYKNEELVWNLFTQNNLLYETDFQKIKAFVGEGPKTPELGDNSPGYIALFTGKRIVETYMEKNPETTPQQLMALDNRKLFEAARYKPN